MFGLKDDNIKKYLSFRMFSWLKVYYLKKNFVMKVT
jgi:hypothetical protein